MRRTPRRLSAQYRTAIVGVLPFANLSDSTDEYFSDGSDRGPDPRAVAAIVLPGAEPQLDVPVQGQEPEHPPDRARDRRHLPDPGLGAARRHQDSRHRRTDRAGERRAIVERPIRPRHRRSVRDAGRDHHQPVGCDRQRKSIARKLPRPPGHVERRHRVGSVPEGPFPLLPSAPRRISKPRSRCSRKPSRSTRRFRSPAPISPPSWRRASSSAGSKSTRELWAS